MSAQSAMSVQTQYTCIACGVGFGTGEDQRGHYKTDWHRYNLRRKVAGLPPITADTFRTRVLAQQALNAAADAAKESLVVSRCSVDFGVIHG